MALTKLTKNLIDGNFGTEWVSTIQTSNFTAEAAKGYFVNTTSQVLYVTLPVGVVGAEIVIQDYAGTFATNKVILAANGSEKIQGVTIGGQITTNNATATLIYQDATRGWTSQDISLIPQDFSGVSYLVVAGGGGGGGGIGSTGGGGGGAGGFRTNYLGTTLTLVKAVNYTVSVGAGGVGGPGAFPTGYGANGNDSTFYNITSTKGGGGSAYSSGTAGAGGSGGGGAYSASGSPVSAKGAGNTPSTTPSQGNDGGLGQNSPTYGGGGGGGASAAGANAPTSQGGNGGDGTNNSITGTALAYAGGGGGGVGANSGAQSSGGNGGGGNGGYNGSVNGSNASPANRGSGGGGGADAGAGSGGNGSSGVVIVRYPNSVTISGLSGTTTTVGTDKVTTFTTGTGNIQFN